MFQKSMINEKTLMFWPVDIGKRTFKKIEFSANGFDYELVWSSTNEHSRIIYGTSWFDDSEHFVTVSRDCKVNILVFKI